MDMKRKARLIDQEGAPMQQPSCAQRDLTASNCVIANIATPHAQVVIKEAPVSKNDCNLCPRCHKLKPKPNKMVKEEIDVFFSIVGRLAKLDPGLIEEALHKKPRVQLAAPTHEPPHTRSQTLASLRHENTTLKEGFLHHLHIICYW